MKIHLLTFLFFCSFPIVVLGQLTSQEKKKTINKVSSKLIKSYVFQDKGKEMAKQLQDNYKNEVYKNISNALQFSKVISRDLFQIAHDLHLALVYKPEAKEKRDSLINVNLGRKIIEASILNNNIGYLDINNFTFKKKLLDHELTKLNNCHAIIIDLRDNYGGYADQSNYLASYFLPGGLHYSSYFNSRNKIADKLVIKNKMKGDKLLNIPLFVLINKNSFSAAELFSYDIQSLNRAIIIGEKSAGGAHSKKNVSINKNYFLSLPHQYSKNLITNSDWEGSGVTPDILIDESRSLEKAIKEALTEPFEKNKYHTINKK